MTATILIVILALHMLCMNVSSAGPLVCLWFQWRERRGDQLAGRVGRFLAWWSVWLLLIGLVFGLGAGFLLWSEHYQGVLGRLKSKIHYAGLEYLFSLVLMVWYAWWWSRSARDGRGKQLGHGTLAVLAGTNLLYHFPFLFLVIVHLAAGGSPAEGPIDAAVFRQLVGEGHILARVAHFWLASFAATGVFLFIYALRLQRGDPESPDARRVAMWGGRMAVLPTLLQLPIGIVVLIQLTVGQQQALMGQNVLATVFFALSIVLAFGLMHHLAAIALGDSRPKALIRTTIMFVVVVVLMTGVARLAVDGLGPSTERTHQAVPQSSVGGGQLTAGSRAEDGLPELREIPSLSVDS